MRKTLFWLHLTMGCLAGAVILIMSITGVLLAFEQQIIRWSERGYRSDTPGSNRLPVAILLEKAKQAAGSPPAGLTIRADPAAPVEAAVGAAGGRILFLDRYTGEVRGEGATGVRAFFRSVTDWHRRLAASGEHRETGRAITGASNLLFAGLIASGIILWMPRTWSWRTVKKVAVFRGGLQGKARDFNWHNVIGVWCALPLLAVVLGALVISYPWATNLVYTLTGTEAPRAVGATQRGGSPSTPAGLSWDGLDQAWATAENTVPGWQVIALRLPPRPAAPYAFTVDLVDGRGRPDKRHVVTVDRQTARVLKTESFGDYNAGRKVRSWLRWIHTGEAGGLTGQTVAGVASGGGAVLVWTGLALALRRFQTWRRKKTAGPADSLVNSELRARPQSILK